MTKDILRGMVVAQIVGVMHTAHVAGPASLVSVETTGDTSYLTFKIGTIYPETTEDKRDEVVIMVRERLYATP